MYGLTSAAIIFAISNVLFVQSAWLKAGNVPTFMQSSAFMKSSNQLEGFNAILKNLTLVSEIFEVIGTGIGDIGGVGLNDIMRLIHSPGDHEIMFSTKFLEMTVKNVATTSPVILSTKQHPSRATSWSANFSTDSQNTTLYRSTTNPSIRTQTFTPTTAKLSNSTRSSTTSSATTVTTSLSTNSTFRPTNSSMTETASSPRPTSTPANSSTTEATTSTPYNATTTLSTDSTKASPTNPSTATQTTTSVHPTTTKTTPRSKTPTATPREKCIDAVSALIGQIQITHPEKIPFLPIVRMIDAWGKLPAGLFQGKRVWFGSYAQCMDIPHAQYCVAGILPKGDDSPIIYQGVCYPNECLKEHVENMYKVTSSALRGILSKALHFPLVSTVLLCDRNEEVSFTLGAKATIAFFGVILFCCLIGTVTEMITGQDDESSEGTQPPAKETTETIEMKEVSSAIESADAIEMTDIGSASENDTEVAAATLDDLEGKRDSISVPERFSISDPSIYERGRSIAPMLPKVDQPALDNSKWVKLLTSFSLLKNTRAILSTDVPKSAITSINGIRFFSMTWVIMGHYYSSLPLILDNPFALKDVWNRLTFQVLPNAFVNVDSFFLLSGLLVSYLTLRRVANGNNLDRKSILLMYLHRYIRLTPSVVIAILFQTHIFPLLITGPMASVVKGRDHCYDYWWTNLLYINNFYPQSFGDECIGHTWYLANDMQFYILAPAILHLILYVQNKSPGKKAVLYNFLLLGGMCFLSMLITGILTGVYDIPSLISAIQFPGNPRAIQGGKTMDWLYAKPYIRITPYIVGIFLGYIFSQNDIALDKKMSRSISSLGWITAAVFAILVVYGPWKVFKNAYSPNAQFFTDAENIMYGACYRFVWSCSLAWVIFACHNKYGGVVDRFLSWKVWVPLSRLTYSAYLFHLNVVYYFVFSRQTINHFQDNIIIYDYVAMVFLSYVVGFVAAVCVEFPMLSLEKIIFKR